MKVRSMWGAVLAMSLLATRGEAQVGKFPLLTPLKNDRGECRYGRPNSVLARQGVSRIAVFMPEDTHRRMSAALARDGKVLMVSAYYESRVSARRVERETLTAMFASDGSFRFGTRSYRVIATPPATRDDREVRLTAKDAEPAMQLGLSIVQRCK